ncbi:hypothetical protein ES707_13280 [subsurface metagenome]
MYSGTFDSPQSLRTHLQNGLSEGLVGCVLVGDFPVPWYEMDDDFEGVYSDFPCDLYYMDLDGNWEDFDNNGRFDSHTSGTGDVAPEIWLGRLTTSTLTWGNEISLLQNYFRKVHAYKTDELSLPKRALAYLDDDWIYSNTWLQLLYDDVTVINDKATTNPDDYKQRLVEDYEWIHIMCHGTYEQHLFMIRDEWDGVVWNSDIKSIDPHVFFFNLFTCSACRYIENNYLGGWYTFADTYGLATIGSTKTGSMKWCDDFYRPLGQGENLGQAFKEWFEERALGGFDLEETRWYYGMTLLGDPTLKVKEAANNPPNTPLAPTGPDTGNPGTSYYFAAATYDPDGDQVCYKFDWGDGSESDWTSFVDSGSAAGEYHTWSSKGIYEVKVKAKDTNDAESGWSEAHTIVINNPPNIPSAPSGPDSGTPGTSYDFTVTTADPDGDQVAFKFDWGDGSESDWTSFVDSGASASASHSWANDGTYQVKVKVKDTNDEESGWSEAHTIVISRPDLTITSISPDTASVDQQVDIIVTVTNQGSQDVTQDFFVDVYYDPSSPPDKGQYGDKRQQITETVQAGESIEATFTHTFNLSGDHEVWVQVDADNLVSETDEDNNIYGPHTIAASERRHENETFSLPAGKWKMISIPFTLDDPSPNAVLVDDLGPQNDAVWKLYRWNIANEGYDKYPNVDDFSPGKSFWIISEDAKAVDTGPGTDVSRQTDFVINLPSGWSQIGNPLPFSIDWNEVRVRRNAEVISILEAQARGWVRDKIWYWDGQSYLVYQAPSGTIDPYEGYWAKALLDCELLVSPNEAQGAKASGQTVNSKEEFLQVKAKVGEFEDNFNFLGLSENAKDGYDRLDIEEAPPISPYISLFFPHPEWDKNKGDYTQDIRARSSQAGLKWTWDFQVKTDQLKKEIILEWENTSAISEELYLYLTDSLSNVLANMREKSSYRFTLSSELELFKIIAIYEALPLPEDLDLTEVYSYPNPAHGAGAKFHFHLASWAKVTIKVYTISGELVRTLVEDKVFLPGAYEEPWEEKNDKGEKLARGVYIFIVQAGNPAKVISKSGKIALLE